ncbi:MAG TPA: hypothetical protein VM712_12840, partial [Gaiellales bacterium]|nr:hypothetical protein [Gaiellales bacterium]
GAPAQGNGLVNLAAAATAPTPQNATQHWRLSVGTGSLEAARGSVHVSVNGRRITGEVDVHGRAFNSSRVASGIANRTNWSGVTWSGVTWSGVTWSGVTWSGNDWA